MTILTLNNGLTLSYPPDSPPLLVYALSRTKLGNERYTLRRKLPFEVLPNDYIVDSGQECLAVKTENTL